MSARSRSHLYLLLVLACGVSACERSEVPLDVEAGGADSGRKPDDRDGGSAGASAASDDSSARDPVCGNGRLEPGEQCDGRTDLICADLGFGDGSLVCEPALCLLDSSGCSARPVCAPAWPSELPPLCVESLCACDPATFSECGERCQGYLECALNACGPDGIATDCPMRACGDDPDLRSAQRLLACVKGSRACSVARRPSRCGNGSAEQGELCDGADLRNQSCGAMGLGDGELRCDPDSCVFDSSGCSVTQATCGNGVVEIGEACDLDALDGASCRTLGFSSGRLRCNALCAFDTSGCARCGNGRVEGDEVCDGDQLAGQSCVARGFSGGTLRCDSACALDDSPCARCGDGAVGPGENCDGAELQGATCASLGLGTGALACGASGCHYDTRGCSEEASCGDGVAQTDEQCDGADLASQDCASLGLGGGELRCNRATCRYDSTLCIRESNLACADACIDEVCQIVLKTCEGTPGCQELRACIDGCRQHPSAACALACTGDAEAASVAIIAADCVSDCFASCR